MNENFKVFYHILTLLHKGLRLKEVKFINNKITVFLFE